MSRRPDGRLALALGISVAALISQLIGSWLSSSLALLADSAHLLGDVASLALALTAAKLASKGVSARRTFGWQRAEILAAAVNAVILIAASIWILLSAFGRLGGEPHEVDSQAMLIFGIVGLIANAVALKLLQRDSLHNANVRGAFLHVVADFAGSVGVITAAFLGLFWPEIPFDTVAGILIAVLILPQAWILLRDTTDVLLEATPRNTDLDEVKAHIMGVPSVLDVHHLHVWMINTGKPVLSAHVVVEDEASNGRVLDALHVCLAEHFDIRHCTFQLEARTHQQHELMMEEY